MGFQLTTFLYGLYFGRRKMPAIPAYLPARDAQLWVLGLEPGMVEVAPECKAVQVDPTTCGSASIVLAQASDPSSQISAVLAGAGAGGAQAAFNELQRAVKTETNRRKGLLGWPQKYGTPPWGASREMTFAGHEYFDRMVVDTSLPQSTRVLTHAAQCALRGFPVLLYVGGDTSMGWDAGVPRHVVVLHSPPVVEPAFDDDSAEPSLQTDLPAEDGLTDAQGSGAYVEGADVELAMEAKLAELEQRIQAKLTQAKAATANEEVFDPEFLVYEPSTGRNTSVTLSQLIDRTVDKAAFGGWPHITWAVMPQPVASPEQQ